MDASTALLAIVAGGLLVYYLLFRNLRHFAELGVPHLRPLPLLGNMAPHVFRRTSLVELLQRVYNRFPRARYVGFYEFGTPLILIRDPELFASIAVKHFDSFTDHRDFVDAKEQPLVGRNLFALRGDTWREMRRLISPAFTSSKMRTMFGLVRECAENFVGVVARESGDGRDLNLRELSKRYTNDAIATCAFGINVDSMRDPGNRFYAFVRRTVDFDDVSSFKFLFGRNFPILTKFPGMKIFGDKVARFFQEIVSDTIRTREERGIARPDVIQLMMEGKKERTTDLSIEDMTAQAFVFFAAGFDAASTFLSFLVLSLATNARAQARLREEIDEALSRSNGPPTYETITRMRYMDAVTSETLRLYPLTAFLDRLCVKDFELPPAVAGGKPLKIKPGTNLWFPSYAVHRDPNYFPEPDRFDPDRFLDEKHHRLSAYAPFGVGPRICIGNRFALMQAKVVLFYLLAKCEFEPCARTSVPVKLSEKTFVMTAKGGFWVKARARRGTQ